MSKAQAAAPIVLAALKLDAIQAAVAAKQVTVAEAAIELTRRIDQRAAAGKHPMPFVVKARDELVDTLEAAGAEIARRQRRVAVAA